MVIAMNTVRIIWYRVLPQGECQFLFAVKVGCVVIWPIFSTSKMKTFCIYFYQGNITFKNIINLVSFIINLVEYLVINSYSVTVLDNFRKETFDRAKRYLFLEAFNSLTFILGNPPLRHLHGPPSWMKVWWRYHFDSLNYHFYFFIFYHISTGKRALQLLYSCMSLSIIYVWSQTGRLFIIQKIDRGGIACHTQSHVTTISLFNWHCCYK